MIQTILSLTAPQKVRMRKRDVNGARKQLLLAKSEVEKANTLSAAAEDSFNRSKA